MMALAGVSLVSQLRIFSVLVEIMVFLLAGVEMVDAKSMRLDGSAPLLQ